MIYLEAFKRVIRSIFKNKDMILILFIGPIALTLFFGGVYYNDYVKDVPVAILDEDGSSLSHLVGSYFLTNERFDVVDYPTSRDNLQKLIDDGKVQMGIYIPNDFERKVTTYQSSEILAITDGSNMVIANNAMAQATLITQSISAGIEMKLIQGKGVVPETAENMALVYNIGERILFDPKMTYMNYLIVCFLAIFIQQLMLAALGAIFTRDSKYISEGSTLVKVLASAAACFVGMIPALIICLVILTKLFHVPFVGNIFIVIVLTLSFIITLIGPSLLIASFTKDRVKYSQFEFMLSLPTFVSSGCVWPLEQMPVLLAAMIKALWPLAYYAKIVQEVLIKGMDFQTVIPYIVKMLIFSAVWTVIGTIIYKRSFKKDKMEVQTAEA